MKKQTGKRPKTINGVSAVLLALGVASLAHNASGSCFPSPAGLVGWWPGDGNANDIVGPDNGTLQGGATPTAPGVVGQAFTFDGTNSFVQIPDAPALHPSNLTIEAWVRFDSLDSAGSGGSPAGDQYIVFKQNTRNGDFEGFDLSKTRVAGGDVFRFLVTSATGQTAEIDSATLLTIGVWYHVAAVRGSNFTQLYVNGYLERQMTVSFSQDYGAFPLYFGTSGQSYWDHKLKGALDEVSLYNRALSSNEVAAIYAAGAAGKCKTVSGLTITTQPQSQSVAVGSNAVFTVGASGVPPLSYQWQFGGAAILSATNTSLTLTNVQTTNAGNYTVVVTNSTASVTSVVAALSVLTPPVITAQPESLTNLAGTTATFNATASGSAPLSYQWQQNGASLRNGGRLSGATGTTLAIGGVQLADAGSYALVASNAVGAVTSTPAILTVLAPPVITTQPASQSVNVGTNVSFGVTVSGTSPLSYRWSFNGTNLADGGQFLGTASPVLFIGNAQMTNAGGYSVAVTNAVGSVTSAVANLTVIVPGSCLPAAAGLIGWWPGDGDANDIVGPDNGTLQGGATATVPGVVGQAFTFDGTNSFVQIPDAPALHPSNLTIEAWVRFDSLDSAGSGGSPAGDQYIAFKQNTRSSDFEGFDLSKTRVAGGDVFRFLVSSASAQTAEIDSASLLTTGVWYHVAAVRGPNFTQLYVNGYLERQMTVGFPQDYGALPLYFGTSGQSYWDHKLKGALDEVSLYNRALSSNEVAAIYAAGAGGKCKTVSGLTITTQPQSQGVAVGSNALFTVGVSGAPPLSYQWQFGGAAMLGATNTSLTLTNVQTTNAGNYTVVVTNSTASVTSVVAALSVLTPPVITAQPESLTNLAGTTATFNATASGSAPLSYQWQQNGVNLGNAGRVSGVTGTTLTVTSVQSPDTGVYTLVASNAVGVVTSTPAILTVLAPPGITTQPASQSVNVGTNVSFSVTVSGTSPLSYQWSFNGTNLGDGGQFLGTRSPVLFIGNAQTTNAGSYSVAVTNAVGSVTSAVANLTVIVPGSCLPAAAGLIGWWPGDGNANDVVGPDNGTLNGGATATAVGEVGQAFNFDGTNSYVSIPDSPILRPANFTIETWVLFNSLNSAGSGGSPAGDQYLVFKQNTRTSDFEGFDLSKTRVAGGDVFRFLVSSASAQTAEIDSATFLTTGVWYHVAAVRGPNFTQLYVNGHLERQMTVSFPQDYGVLPVYFGTSGQSYWDHKLEGSLDEVSLYNRALSSSEVAAIYAAGAGGKCKGAVMPTIVTQPTNHILMAGGSVTFTVNAVGTSPLGYQWQKDGTKLSNGGNISGATSSALTLANLQVTDIGNYQVVVANNWGSVTSIVASLSTGVPPPNDDFAAAQAISGSSGSVSGNNANATKQPGEPNHAGNPGGASVWYDWTAPSTSPVTFDTALSAFDTLLAVYTGSAVNALTLVASNNDISTNNARSRLTFTPVSGTVYRIAVDGANGASGNLTLRWAQATTPLADLAVVGSAVNPAITTETFAPSSCAVMEGLIQAGTRRLIRFSTETENQGTADLFFGNPANNPLFVWAPCHAHYHFNNYMSYRLRDANGRIAALGLKVGFCVLDVFRWSPSAPSSAKYNCGNQGIQAGWGDLYDSTLDGQWIDITGLPDGNYTIEIEANPQGIIQESNYANNITQVPIAIGNPNAPPLNDNFANAEALPGSFSSVPGITVNATKEPGEPNHAGNPGGHSVWYQWTALDTKAVTIDTLGSSFNTLLAVYTGSSLSGLSVVAGNDDIGPGILQSRVTFSATAGTVYQIAVDGFNGAAGNLILTLNQTIQNDNFVNAEFIGGVNGVVHGSNAGATKEPGEPNHAGNSGGASIWYAWTAPINGTATFDTLGSTFNTLLGAYTGSAVNSLTTVASNDDIDAANGILQSRITFDAAGLSRYYIAIDGFNGVTGDTTLNWNLVSGGAAMAAIGSFGQDKGTLATAGAGRPVLAQNFLGEGEFQLTVAGLPLQRYLIERSCDLAHWTPLVATVADSAGLAYFVDKTTMHLERQARSGDPLCGPGQLSGTSFSPGVMRFYRATVLGPN
jgi:hypothetical protein